MLVSLKELLPQAAESDYAVPCFNVFGYEDAYAVVEAAEAVGKPVILACNKDVADFYGVETAAAMLLPLAHNSSVPVCLHLDHTYEEDVVYRALKAGFSSVMFDGSQLPLDENIARTRAVADVAHALGASVEGEIGSVPYEEGRDHIKSIYTEPEDALRFAKESGADCVAISVGNVHRLTEPTCTIDFGRLDRIANMVDIPLVIHGTSGIRDEDMQELKRTRVSKFNIGTCLRQALGHNLRDFMNAEPQKFDRIYFMRKAMPFVKEEAIRNFELLS
ncbi:class II fructose-bisphosphate aldolase family protein [Photobacterium sp. BZF1]|uniref:class II fructose-bisphosphate aldolase n=1 Tax=Photobacterium sp. BZF1 TaxID=1904457 RepID=UPI0016539880|nr:class II fructose-bisphosphate aldolase [Photobacterium sp. BZF1]MBC7003577.1 class II fructose-bisphosphate aldolase family protein [Photobacterium sp. BZF1]